MREKIVGGFYSIFSAVIWFSAFCGILFLFYLLFSAYTRPPEITVCASTPPVHAAEDDPALLEINENPADWYTVTLSLNLKGSVLSPFAYSAERLYMRNTGGTPNFIVTSEPIAFSHVVPQDLTATVYLQYDGDAETLSALIQNAQLRLESKKMHVGFFEIDVYNTDITKTG